MEAKELLDFLGVEATNLDEFKTQFSGKYFTEKQIHDDKKLLGKFTGTTLKKIKQTVLNDFREAEVPFTHGEFDDMELEGVVKTLRSRQAELFTGKINEVQSQIGKGAEEIEKKYQEKLSKYEQSLLDEKNAKKAVAEEYEKFKGEAEGRIKSTRVDYFKKDLTSDIESAFDVAAKKDELKMKGWRSHISENFRFDFDEHDQPVILDKNGSKIKNPKKADEWLSPKDVLKEEADKLGLIPKNPQGGQPAFRPPVNMQQGQPKMPAQAVIPQSEGVKRNKLAPGMEQYVTK